LWEPRLCGECRDSEFEEHERINGKPSCESCGLCKYLDNLPARVKGISGSPLQYMTAGGLSEFFLQATRIHNLSPITDFGPTLQALGWMEWETSIPVAEYQELLDIWHNKAIAPWIKARSGK
jgi:hypothetical protein